MTWDNNQPRNWGGIPQNQPPWTGQGPIVQPPGTPDTRTPPPGPGRRRPGLAPTILITGFFGLFGLIPAVRHARRSRALGFPGKDYWLAFGLSMVPALALHSAIAALVIVLAMPGATPIRTPGQGTGAGGSQGQGQGQGQGPSQGRTGGDATVVGCQPAEALVPGDTVEACGEQILAASTARLFRYEPSSGEPVPDIAESVTTADNRTFTVKLRPGYLFSDGTEVHARNFVDAWNLMVSKQQIGSYVLAFVDGYGGPGSSLTGLSVVDTHTFTIRTTEPVPDMAARLGVIQLAPLPDSYFANPSAYEVEPVGAGPFRITSKGTSEIVLVRSERYSGQTPAHLDRLTFRLFADPEAGYQSLRNGESAVAALPPSQQGSGRAEIDNAGRIANPPRGVVSVLVVSPTDQQLADPKLRQALSMAIDRENVIRSALVAGVPAAGWVPPGMPGGGGDACGRACTFDRDRAKQLYAESGGYQGTLTVTVNADGNHRMWAQAVCSSINGALGIDCQVRVEPDFRTFMDKATKGELSGLYRSGWQMDAPSAGNFLAPIYGSGQVSNWSRYSNPTFDATLRDAQAATDPAESQRLFARAEQLLGQDLPSIPMWHGTAPTTWSDQVAQVSFDPWGRVDYARLQRA